jgi:hypothetical protein
LRSPAITIDELASRIDPVFNEHFIERPQSTVRGLAPRRTGFQTLVVREHERERPLAPGA